MSTYERTADGTYLPLLSELFQTYRSPWLTPIVATRTGDVFGLDDGAELQVIEAATLLPRSRFQIDPNDEPTTGLLVCGPFSQKLIWIFAAEDRWYVTRENDQPAELLHALMGPRLPTGSSLLSVPIATSWPGRNMLQLAWISDFGTLCWGRLKFDDGDAISGTSWATSGTRGGYRAAGFISSYDVAGVHGTQVDRFRESEGRLLPRRSSKCDLDGIVASVPRPRGGIVLINSDGFAQQIEPGF